MHGVICETTRLATSDFDFCDFETSYLGDYGSFSFKPINSSDQIKCSKFVQTGFQDIKMPNLLYLKVIVEWEARI